jgi:hypothetical protein
MAIYGTVGPKENSIKFLHSGLLKQYVHSPLQQLQPVQLLPTLEPFQFVGLFRLPVKSPIPKSIP